MAAENAASAVTHTGRSDGVTGYDTIVRNSVVDLERTPYEAGVADSQDRRVT